MQAFIRTMTQEENKVVAKVAIADDANKYLCSVLIKIPKASYKKEILDNEIMKTMKNMVEPQSEKGLRETIQRDLQIQSQYALSDKTVAQLKKR